MIVDREELAWAAGFFDGEGYVGMTLREPSPSGYRTPRLQVSLSQVDRRVLDRFVAAVGVGKVNGPYRPRSAKSQPVYTVQMTSFEAAQHVVGVLFPWLSEVKRDAAIQALASFRSYRGRTECPKGHPLTVRPRLRWCSTCRSEAARLRWAKQKEKQCALG